MLTDNILVLIKNLKKNHTKCLNSIEQMKDFPVLEHYDRLELRRHWYNNNLRFQDQYNKEFKFAALKHDFKIMHSIVTLCHDAIRLVQNELERTNVNNEETINNFLKALDLQKRLFCTAFENYIELLEGNEFFEEI